MRETDGIGRDDLGAMPRNLHECISGSATGWDIIAVFNDVSASLLDQAIDNGSIISLIGVAEVAF